MKQEEIDIIFDKQKSFFKSRKTKSIEFRIEQLKKLESLIEINTDKIIDALKSDFNKNVYESFTSEIFYSLKEIRTLRKNLKKWSKPVKVKTPLVNKPGKSYYKLEPFGIALIICPWNYPFGLLITPLAGAIAAGNCVIAKPSELTKHTSKLIHELLSVEFDESYIKVVEGDALVTQSLINKNVDYIFFTGSTDVGRKIMQKASEYLIPATLELGGKSPCIIDKDVDLKVAVRRIAWGKFFNAGQTCIAPDYILVDKKIKNDFINEFKKVVEEFYHQKSIKDDFTHIINEKHFDRLVALMNDGRIIIGGNHDRENLYISPTVIDDINFDSKIMQEEIFGPLLPVIVYDDFKGIIAMLNERDKPLLTYFFSKDKNKQNEVIDIMRCGSVCINGTIHLFLSNELPFGGVGLSGMGRYHGFSSLETFSFKKAVLVKSFFADLKVTYPPYKTPLNFLKKSLKYFY